jgi:hypothetical protein
MLNYKFKDDDVDKTCEKYGINKNEFENMRDDIGKFYTNVRLQHLSSIMRNLEIKGRFITKDNNFRIEWGEMENDSNDAHCIFDLAEMLTESKFTISLPKNIDDEQARYVVAHELGYLFYVLEMIEKTPKTRDEIVMLTFKLKEKDTQNTLHRKSNIFAIVIIQERIDFYKTKVISPDGIIHKTVDKPMEELITHFD